MFFWILDYFGSIGKGRKFKQAVFEIPHKVEQNQNRDFLLALPVEQQFLKRFEAFRVRKAAGNKGFINLSPNGEHTNALVPLYPSFPLSHFLMFSF